jgi:hypothetical protein
MLYSPEHVFRNVVHPETILFRNADKDMFRVVRYVIKLVLKNDSRKNDIFDKKELSHFFDMQ